MAIAQPVLIVAINRGYTAATQKEYSSIRYGYTVKLPVDWKLGRGGLETDFTEFETNLPETAFQITVVPLGKKDQSLLDHLHRLDKEIEGNYEGVPDASVEEGKKVTIGGLIGYQRREFYTTASEEVMATYTLWKKQVVAFSLLRRTELTNKHLGPSDEQLYNAILSTIHFLQQ